MEQLLFYYSIAKACQSVFHLTPFQVGMIFFPLKYCRVKARSMRALVSRYRLHILILAGVVCYFTPITTAGEFTFYT